MQENDEFNNDKLGLQWQWHANPKEGWALPFPSAGVLRLNSILQTDSIKNLWLVPNLLLQKLPAEKFSATVKFSFAPKTAGERFGFVMMGSSYAYLSLEKKENGLFLAYGNCMNADKGNAEEEKILDMVQRENIYFRITVNTGAQCSFSYSSDGIAFTTVDKNFTAQPGRWIGAKIGFFCTRTVKTNDAGFAELDWFRIEK